MDLPAEILFESIPYREDLSIAELSKNPVLSFAFSDICNSSGIRLLSWLTYLSTWWQLLAPLIVSLSLLIGAKPGHQTMKFVFTEFHNETGWTNKVI